MKKSRIKFTIFLITLLTFIVFNQNLLAQNSGKKKYPIDSIIQKKMRQTGIVGLGASIIIDKKEFGKKVLDMLIKKIKLLLSL